MVGLYRSALVLWLAAAAVAEAGQAKVVDGRVVEVAQPGGRRLFCWFELDGDKLIRDYVLGRMDELGYEISRMGAKMPPAPSLALRTGPKPPAKDIPCWPVAAAATIGDDLWVALAPVPQPKRLMWIGMPPHPHHRVSGGDPWEGGIFQIDPVTRQGKHWASANGLPGALVCHDSGGGQPLPRELAVGAVVQGIRAEGGRVAFTTRNGSKALCDRRLGQWTVVRSGEPKALMDFVRSPRHHLAKGYAIRRLGTLRATEAVPLLVEILGGSPTSAGTDHRFPAMEALIDIGDKACIARLEPLARSENLRTAQFARATIQELQTGFGEPVNGLAFRLTSFWEPCPAGEGLTAYLDVRNAADHPIALCYDDPWPLSPHLILHLVREDGMRVQRTLADRHRTKVHVLEPDEIKRLSRSVSAPAPGTYRLHYVVSIPEEFARTVVERRRIRYHRDLPHAWTGEAVTNAIPLRVLPSRAHGANGPH